VGTPFHSECENFSTGLCHLHFIFHDFYIIALYLFFDILKAVRCTNELEDVLIFIIRDF